MYKVFRSDSTTTTTSTATVTPTESTEKRRISLCLTAQEMSVFRNTLEEQKQRVLGAVEGAEELRLENLVDDLDLDPDTARALLVSNVLL